MKYTVKRTPGSISVKHIIDTKPEVFYKDDVCTVYQTGALEAAQIANALNMAHELGKLPNSATKSEMLEIINKYKK